jgi:tetratricopeptide (TPR) repeat protein
MSYGIYLWQLFVLGGHSVLYPIPLNPWLPPGQVLATAAVLVIITAVAATNVVRRPWLAAGWAWFLLITFPMSGIVAIGEHAHADRYTYLPHLLLIAALVHQLWQFGWRTAPRAWVRWPAQAVVLVYLAGLFLKTWDWVACWHESETVLMRSLEVTGPNPPLLRTLGTYYDMTDEPAAALRCFELAVESEPREVDARALLLRRLVRDGRVAEAEQAFDSLAGKSPGLAVDVAEKLWEFDATDHQPADRLAFVWRHVHAAAEARGDVERAREAARRIERDE